MKMKKLIYLAIFVAAIATMIQHFRNPEQPNPELNARMVLWICPVHREMQFNKAGTCSLCGRELIKKDAAEEQW